MQFETPLIRGKIIKRYKRFLADVELESGEVITAHTANTGSMKTCWEPGWDVALSYHDNPKRKLKYSLEMTHNGSCWIGINTSLPNKLAIAAIKKGEIPELSEFETLKPEVKVGDSRIDILLTTQNKKKIYIEVKNVTLKSGNRALFPDSVSTRGQKHLRELIDIKKQGHAAYMLYVVQRTDVQSFAPAEEHDPEYAGLLRKAKEAGVGILVYQFDVGPEKIVLKSAIPQHI